MAGCVGSVGETSRWGGVTVGNEQLRGLTGVTASRTELRRSVETSYQLRHGRSPNSTRPLATRRRPHTQCEAGAAFCNEWMYMNTIYPQGLHLARSRHATCRIEEQYSHIAKSAPSAEKVCDLRSVGAASVAAVRAAAAGHCTPGSEAVDVIPLQVCAPDVVPAGVIAGQGAVKVHILQVLHHGAAAADLQAAAGGCM